MSSGSGIPGLYTTPQLRYCLPGVQLVVVRQLLCVPRVGFPEQASIEVLAYDRGINRGCHDSQAIGKAEYVPVDPVPFRLLVEAPMLSVGSE